MIKTPIGLQDLRRRIYVKAKTDKKWRFWGLYVHVCKLEVLKEAYKKAKENNGAPGADGMSFQDIESRGVDSFLEEIREELISETYRPTRYREKQIPKEGGTRTLKIPAIRDRVVEGALKLILEAIFEADFQEGSYGFRPKRSMHEAIKRVEKGIVEGKTRVIDLDLKSYFDAIRHDILLKKIAERVQDKKILRLLKLIMKTAGKRGVCQGGVISTLLANIYLNEIDKMLEKAKNVTRRGGYTHVEYARFADDLVILIDWHPRWDWLEKMVYKRLQEELSKIDVEINTDKTKKIDLNQKGSFSFLGFDIRLVKAFKGKYYPYKTPRKKSRAKLIKQLKEVFRRKRSQPVKELIEKINPKIRGWVNHFRIGNSTRCFKYIRRWVEKKIRRHMMRAKGLQGFNWKRWSSEWIHEKLGLYNDYKIRYYL